MSIDHRGADISVPQELLNGSNLIAIFREMRGKGVPKRMASGGPRNTCLEPSLFDGFLQNGFVNNAGCGLPAAPDQGAWALTFASLKLGFLPSRRPQSRQA